MPPVMRWTVATWWLRLVSGAVSKLRDWEPSPRCLRRPKKGERFLVVVHAREGMNKNVAMIAEAAQWAVESNRTLVEPAMCEGRVVSPFETAREAGEIVVKGVLPYEVARPKTKCSSKRKLGLSAYWDLEPLCRVVPVISWVAWRRLGREGETASFHTPHFAGLTRAPGVHRANPSPDFESTAKVLYVAGWFRSVSTFDLSRGACSVRPCFGNLKFERSGAVAARARALLDEFKRPFTCVQWRSELKATRENVVDCARALARAAATARHREGVPRAPVLLVTDLKPNTSTTYHLPSDAFTRALDVLTSELASDRASRAFDEQVAHSFDDDGLRSLLAQEVCADAPTLVMCLGSRRATCRNCARGLDSGFVAGIYYLRNKKAPNRSVFLNRKGGIWEW